MAIHEDARREPFELDDGTGRALVIPDGAEVSLSDASRHRTSLFSEIPARLQSYMSKAGLSTRDRGLRFTEDCIEIGQIDIGNLDLASRRWRETSSNLNYVIVVHIQPGNREIGFRLRLAN